MLSAAAAFTDHWMCCGACQDGIPCGAGDPLMAAMEAEAAADMLALAPEGADVAAKPWLKPHGTRAAYRRHHRHGEPPCDLCRDAHNEWARAVNQPRRNVARALAAAEQALAAGDPPALAAALLRIRKWLDYGVEPGRAAFQRGITYVPATLGYVTPDRTEERESHDRQHQVGNA
jgi:hypothetical protein